MRGQRSRLALALVAGLLLALAVGCGESNKGEEPAATSQRVTASPAATPSPLPDIRTLDLSKQPDVQDLAQRLGGEVAPEEIVYADLTGDGRDEAVVPISSGGTQGDLGFVVLGYQDGGLKALLTEAPKNVSVRVEIRNGQLVESLPLYSEGDLPGFPSQLKNIYYAWRGDHFVVDREEVINNPNLPPKQ